MTQHQLVKTEGEIFPGIAKTTWWSVWPMSYTSVYPGAPPYLALHPREAGPPNVAASHVPCSHRSPPMPPTRSPCLRDRESVGWDATFREHAEAARGHVVGTTDLRCEHWGPTSWETTCHLHVGLKVRMPRGVGGVAGQRQRGWTGCQHDQYRGASREMRHHWLTFVAWKQLRLREKGDGSYHGESGGATNSVHAR